MSIFANKGTSFASSLIKIFKDNDDDIFGEFCIQILGYYSQRGTEYYSNIILFDLIIYIEFFLN